MKRDQSVVHSSGPPNNVSSSSFTSLTNRRLSIKRDTCFGCKVTEPTLRPTDQLLLALQLVLSVACQLLFGQQGGLALGLQTGRVLLGSPPLLLQDHGSLHLFLHVYDAERAFAYFSICLCCFSSRAWAFICCTSMVSGLRRRMYSSWFPMHSCRMRLLMRSLGA
ncbi:hypothetical protein F7725_019752 [Dissostichus mawsoni]|uniref:Uncharacterized protein n=1 Tax=Dissostichus mawsoni TaxID=36200 RepID=A0A7J5YLK0_DISMA|nr:hypothetical protein F7725_019752 [Dissostichus mawsoni]